MEDLHIKSSFPNLLLFSVVSVGVPYALERGKRRMVREGWNIQPPTSWKNKLYKLISIYAGPIHSLFYLAHFFFLLKSSDREGEGVGSGNWVERVFGLERRRDEEVVNKRKEPTSKVAFGFSDRALIWGHLLRSLLFIVPLVDWRRVVVGVGEMIKSLLISVSSSSSSSPQVLPSYEGPGCAICHCEYPVVRSSMIYSLFTLNLINIECCHLLFL